MADCRTLLVVIAIMWSYIDSGTCFRDGANPVVCNTRDMKPDHGAGSESNSSQFEIELSTDVYDPTDHLTPVTVRLISPQSILFKGFLIQARKVDSFDYVAKGKMQGPPTWTAIICGRTLGNGLTHTPRFSQTFRKEISMRWIPPNDTCKTLEIGDLHFQATVVKQYNVDSQINIFSKVLRMSNNTRRSIIEGCKKGGASSAALTSTTRRSITEGSTKGGAPSAGLTSTITLFIPLALILF